MIENPPAPIVQRNGSVTVVTLGPEHSDLYERAASAVADALLDVVRTAEPPLVAIDLPHTKYVGSAFLGLLVRVSNKLRSRGGRLGLCNVTPYCAAVMKMSKLDEVCWEVFDSTEAAVEGLASDP